jgi:hypothetical protein
LEVLELQGSWDKNSWRISGTKGTQLWRNVPEEDEIAKKKREKQANKKTTNIIPAYSTYISHMRVSPPPRPEIREIGIGSMDWKRQGGHCPLILQQQQWRRRIQALDFNNPPPAAATCSPQH